VVRFTIRDGLFVVTIVGVALAWWLDHRQLSESVKGLVKDLAHVRTENLKLSIRNELNETKRIDELDEAAKRSSLSPSEVDEVLQFVGSEFDIRVRVRAMAILPRLKDREKAIDVLIEALHDRKEGVVPQYAAKYLAHMRAVRAIEEVKAWVDYLKTENPYDEESRAVMLKTGESALAQLMTSAESAIPN